MQTKFLDYMITCSANHLSKKLITYLSSGKK
jgi:hypothetical protein